MPAKLYLCPAPLDFGCEPLAPITDVMPMGTLQVMSGITHWVCENAKTTRAVLKRVGEVVPLAATIQEQSITELPREVHKKGDHIAGQSKASSANANDAKASGFDAKQLLAAALQGHHVGLISEAGMPAIADPGSSVVRAAHALGIEVVPLVGPCSLLLALAASGLNGQNFAFVGYLPQDATERAQRISALEKLTLHSGQTQLFIETPYRNAALRDALLKTLAPSTRLSASVGLTLATARTASLLVSEWRQAKPVLDWALPCVFGIGR
jgi:16S rRNA (cytidine1402-2'-O)-methyltransferase